MEVFVVGLTFMALSPHRFQLSCEQAAGGYKQNLKRLNQFKMKLEAAEGHTEPCRIIIFSRLLEDVFAYCLLT